MELKFWLHKHCWWVVPVLFITAVLLPALFGLTGHFTHFLTWAAVIGMALYLIQKQCLVEKKAAVSVQRHFFQGFSELRPKLDGIIQSDPSLDLTPEQINHLSMYVNLCSEAYWQYCNGLVAPFVWRSWVNRMRGLYYHPKIRIQWEKELKNDSHYGFDIDIIR